MQQLAPIPLGRYEAHEPPITFTALWDPSDDQRLLRNVTVPTLTPYLPDPGTATGTGVVIAPGGGLHVLAVENEGSWVAQRLAERGIAAFVLHYRVAPTPLAEEAFAAVAQRIATEPQFVADVSRAQRGPSLVDGGAAMRLVRDNATAWGVEPDRIGMLGFSAGGFLSLVTTLDGTAAERPSFLAPIYPAWWDDVQVPEDAPPMFLSWASDDQLGDTIVDSCLRLYTGWRRAGTPVEAHAFASGGHGFGIRSQGAPSDAWFAAFLSWLTASGF